MEGTRNKNNLEGTRRFAPALSNLINAVNMLKSKETTPALRATPPRRGIKSKPPWWWGIKSKSKRRLV